MNKLKYSNLWNLNISLSYKKYTAILWLILISSSEIFLIAHTHSRDQATAQGCELLLRLVDKLVKFISQYIVRASQSHNNLDYFHLAEQYSVITFWWEKYLKRKIFEKYS